MAVQALSSEALFFPKHAQDILANRAPHRIKKEDARNNQGTPNPMRALDIKPDKGSNHNRVKGKGVKESP